MGYRSDVGLVAIFPSQIQCLAWAMQLKDAVENLKDGAAWSGDLWDGYVRFPTPETFVMQMDSVKFYDDYRDVDAIRRAMKEVSKNGGVYRFLRIGEEDEDIEQEEDTSADPDGSLSEPLWEYLSLHRSINWGI